MRSPEVTSIGEAFIDLVSSKPAKDLSLAQHFVKVAGGAPANVAVGLAQLGIRTAFLGKVGQDSFGRFVKNELQRYGVETRWIVDDANHKTRLAFVAVTKNGDRDFEFWEKDPADQHLLMKDVDLPGVCRSALINIGPFMLLNAGTRKIAFAIALCAKKQKTSICFDPNVRISLWKNSQGALRTYRAMVRLTTILRLNEDEARFLAGTQQLQKAVSRLLSLGPDLVVITRAQKGCTFATKEYFCTVKGFSVKVLDTTGCGDGFLAGLVAGIIRSKKQIKDLSRSDLHVICRTANAVGALVATQRGAIAAMPSLDKVKQFLRRQT